MKRKIKIIVLVFFSLCISCENEDIDDSLFVDPNQVEVVNEGEDVQEDEEDEEDEEAFIVDEFTTEDGITYYTGSTTCFRSGNYNVNEDKVLTALTIPDDLPIDFDLSSFLPPVGDQGLQGSCVSWAATYYLKSLQENIETGEMNVLSPAYTYNQISQGICEGTGIPATLDILKNKGAASLESFPYLDNTCNIQPNEIQDMEAENHRILDYEYLSGENMVLEMKTLLTNQTPILISTFLSNQFGKMDSLGLTAYREHTIDYNVSGGCHAMLVVGYSDLNNAFKVVNSWGTGWGDNGFVWIDYKAFENVSDQNSSFRVINQAIIAHDL